MAVYQTEHGAAMDYILNSADDGDLLINRVTNEVRIKNIYPKRFESVERQLLLLGAKDFDRFMPEDSESGHIIVKNAKKLIEDLYARGVAQSDKLIR